MALRSLFGGRLRGRKSNTGVSGTAQVPAGDVPGAGLASLLRQEVVLAPELAASLNAAAEEGFSFYKELNSSRLELAFSSFDEEMRKALFEVLFLLHANDPSLAEWRYTATRYTGKGGGGRTAEEPATAELYIEGAPHGVRNMGRLSPVFREPFQAYVQDTFGMQATGNGSGVIVSVSAAGSIGTIAHKSLTSDLDLNVQYDLAPFLFDADGWNDETFHEALSRELTQLLRAMRRQRGLPSEALHDPHVRGELEGHAHARLAKMYPRLVDFLFENPGSYPAQLEAPSSGELRHALLGELILLMKRAPSLAQGAAMKKQEALLTERIERIQAYVTDKFPSVEIYLFPSSNGDFRLGRHASTLESKESPGSAYELLLNYETLMPGIQITGNVPAHFLFSKAVNDHPPDYRRYVDYARFNLLQPLAAFRDGMVDLGPTPDLKADYVARHKGAVYWEAFKASSGNLPKATLNLLRFEMLLDQPLLKTNIQLIKEPGFLDHMVRAGDGASEAQALAEDRAGVPNHVLLELEAEHPLLRRDPWWLRYKALKIGFWEPEGVPGLQPEERQRISRTMDHALALHVRISDVFTKPGDTRKFDSHREQVLLSLLERAFPVGTPRRTFLEHLFVGEVRAVNQFEQQLRELFRSCLERVNAKIERFGLPEGEQREEFRLWRHYYQRNFEPAPNVIQRGIMSHLKVPRGRLQTGFNPERGWTFRSLQRESGVGKRFDTFGTLNHLPDEVELHESAGFLGGLAHCILNGYYGVLNPGTLKERRTVLEFDHAALDMGHPAHNTLAFIRPDQTERLMDRINQVFPYRPYHYLDCLRLERKVTDVFVLLNLLNFGRLSLLYRDNLHDWSCEEFDHPELVDDAEKLAQNPAAVLSAAPIHETLESFFRMNDVFPEDVNLAGWVNPNSVETKHGPANAVGKEKDLAGLWEQVITRSHGRSGGYSTAAGLGGVPAAPIAAVAAGGSLAAGPAASHPARPPGETPERVASAGGWEAKYLELLGELGVSPEQAAQKDKRSHHRFRPKAGAPERSIQCGERRCTLINISAGGICVASDFPFPPGGEMAVTLADGFRVRMRVTSSRPAEDAEQRALGNFLVGARFKSEPDGYRCFVLVVGNSADDEGLGKRAV